jgi:hypothetical protein
MFKGLEIQMPTEQRPYTSPRGFRGITYVLPNNVRFIRVTDFQGFPLPGTAVIVNNTGSAEVSITDSNGLCEIIPDTAQNITIDLQQHQTVRKGIPYNTTVQGITTVLILEPFAYLK